MSVLRRLAALAFAAVCLAPVAANAIDANDIPDHVAFSGVPTLLHLCGGKAAILSDKACKQDYYAQNAAALDLALRDALDKAPANVQPLLKRDQYWFGETVRSALRNGTPEREMRDHMLIPRIVTLAQIAKGLPRTGVLGKWENAFGRVTVTAAEDGGYRLAIATDSGYGQDDEHHWRCQATAMVKPSSDGWLTGTFFPGTKPEQAEAAAKAGGFKIAPFKPLAIRMRRQGETLRVVTAEPDTARENTPDDCRNIGQITASYFPSGKADAAASADKIDTTFVAPTFDCARPDSPVEEEICADPELADNDQRLNLAWKALLPRLEETTRRALVEDQRLWVREQADQFAYSLHPAREKLYADLHHTLGVRTDVGKLQRERIAMLEGFDEGRQGLAGLWLGHTAVLNVELTDDGVVSAKGFKWVGDYKGGCEYGINGKLVNGTFRSEEKRKNPDTLERDQAMLVVNQLDDEFSKKRFGSKNPDKDPDDQKCERSPSVSSTARLFPVRPSPDIDETGGWHD
jgi:uncharacterized protein YecT (DUF1311 family)